MHPPSVVYWTTTKALYNWIFAPVTNKLRTLANTRSLLSTNLMQPRHTPPSQTTIEPITLPGFLAVVCLLRNRVYT